MSDLTVEYEALEHSHDALTSIKGVLDGLEHDVSDASDVWGDSDVADAMHTFATNWGYHRKKLTSLIDSGGEKFEKTLSAFRDADTKLGQQIEGTVKVGR